MTFAQGIAGKMLKRDLSRRRGIERNFSVVLGIISRACNQLSKGFCLLRHPRISMAMEQARGRDETRRVFLLDVGLLCGCNVSIYTEISRSFTGSITSSTITFSSESFKCRKWPKSLRHADRFRCLDMVMDTRGSWRQDMGLCVLVVYF